MNIKAVILLTYNLIMVSCTSSLEIQKNRYTTSFTYRNGYILDKKGKIIGNYANGHIFDKERNIKGFYSNGFIYDKNHNIIGNYNNGFVTFKEK